MYFVEDTVNGKIAYDMVYRLYNFLLLATLKNSNICHSPFAQSYAERPEAGDRKQLGTWDGARKTTISISVNSPQAPVVA
ncbi:unnamed protein product [Clavelina lepadiformis]|uniref:Uncharacterized protein n=1 Tax=Clavelina lepadiformis TaxID=159417 RepID=A0ABP0H2I4_CLALP